MSTDTATLTATVARLHGEETAAFVAERYPSALPLLANGWTIDSALDHVQGMCDQMLCTGTHGDAAPMALVLTHSRTRTDGSEGPVVAAFGPFEDSDAARAWAEANVDARTVWTTQDVTAPF